jgi:menaquinone-dependent protoporphyrinogen oxidase
MKTAIIFASKHGTTTKVAHQIGALIGNDKTEIFNLKESAHLDLSNFERIIVGGSIHAGGIQKSIKNFCITHTVDLLQKPLGLFICCMDEQRAMSEFETAYPELLRNHAKSKKVMGGEFLFDQFNFIEKFLVKKISGITSTVSKIDDDKVREMAVEMMN